MYKCLNCRRTFEEPETAKEFVPYGNADVSYNVGVCPYCERSDYEEAYPCKDCGEYFTENELNCFYCDDCIKENWDKVGDLFDFAQKDTADGEINKFVLFLFDNVENINFVMKLLLNFMSTFDYDVFKKKKRQYIELHKEELAEELEVQNEQTEIL